MEIYPENVYTISNSPNRKTATFSNLVTIKSRSSALQKPNFLKRSLLISNILIAILLFAFLVALHKYLKANIELKKLKKTSMCTSEECLRSATNLKLSMDLTVDPCEDFYKFTCGRWTKEHLNHGWYPHYSSFEIADERIKVSAINFFQSNISLDEPLPARESQDLYLSCMDTKMLDNLGVTVITEHLKKLNLPVVPNYFNKSRDPNFEFDWIKAEVDLRKSFAMDNFIGLVVSPDYYNRSNNNVIHLTVPDPDSPLPTLLKSQILKALQKESEDDDEDDEEKEEDEEAIEDAYKNVVEEVIRIIVESQEGNVTDELIEDAANDIWNITTDVSEFLALKSPSLEYLKVKVDDLQNVTNQYLMKHNETITIIWRRYLTLLFEGVQNVTLDLDKQDLLYIHEKELDYFPVIALYLSQASDLQIELYMWWSAVSAMLLSSTTEIKNIIKEEEEALGILDVQQPRSIYCASVVIKFMGLAVSYGVADRSFLNDTEPKVHQMIDNIKDAFVERVTNLNWMDAETKRLTLEKSKAMISFIGYPEWLMDKATLEAYYSGVVIQNDTFLDNMMIIIKIATRKELESLRKNSERNWVTDPTTINAFNYFADNSITVPMGILTFPFYNLGLEVLNYGAIGSILGHELIHGFDNTGRLFDKYGNYKEWWTNKTRMTFENKTDCFVNQYNDLSVPSIDENVNGTKTLGENLADNGGLNHAFLAYQKYVKIHGPESQLPGFENFTNLQMFFMAYSSVWCETTDTDILTYQIATDEHSPNPIRVLGTLQNSKQFTDAFQCPLGSKMNPKRNRCGIW